MVFPGHGFSQAICFGSLARPAYRPGSGPSIDAGCVLERRTPRHGTCVVSFSLSTGCARRLPARGTAQTTPRNARTSDRLKPVRTPWCLNIRHGHSDPCLRPAFLGATRNLCVLVYPHLPPTGPSGSITRNRRQNTRPSPHAESSTVLSDVHGHHSRIKSDRRGVPPSAVKVICHVHTHELTR